MNFHHKELSMLAKRISSPIQGCTCWASLHLMRRPGTPGFRGVLVSWRWWWWRSRYPTITLDPSQSALIWDHKIPRVLRISCHLGQVYDPTASINQMDIIFQGCCSLKLYFGGFMRNKHFPGNLFKRHLSKWVRPWTRGPHLYSLY